MLQRLFTLAAIVSLTLFGAVGVLWSTRPDTTTLNVHSLVEFEWRGRRWAVDSVPGGITVSDRPELEIEERRLDRQLDRAVRRAMTAHAQAEQPHRDRRAAAEAFQDLMARRDMVTPLTASRVRVVSARASAATRPSVTYARAGTATLLFPAAWVVGTGLRLRRSRRRHRNNHCPTCDYDLRGTPGRCPECGWNTR